MKSLKMLVASTLIPIAALLSACTDGQKIADNMDEQLKHPWLTESAQQLLQEEKIPVEEFEKYGSVLVENSLTYDLIKAYNEGFTPDEVAGFDDSYTIFDRAYFLRNNITVACANGFAEQGQQGPSWDRNRIAHFCMAGDDAAYVEEQVGHSRFSRGEAGTNLLHGIDNEVEATYHELASADDIQVLNAAGISGEESAPWFELNAKYGVSIDGLDIVRFEKSGTSYERIEKLAEEEMLRRMIDN